MKHLKRTGRSVAVTGVALLAALSTAALTAPVAGASTAAGATVAAAHTGRVPGGVRRVSVLVTFPPGGGPVRAPIRRVLTSAGKVDELVAAADRLKPAPIHEICPQIVFPRPMLTLTFSASAGTALAELRVGVSMGTRGDSGASGCFPIEFQARDGAQVRLVGNAFVRLVGRLAGVSIS